MWLGSRKAQMVGPDEALPGRDTPMTAPRDHLVLGTPLLPPWPPRHEVATLAMGCFWGAERVFWEMEGVWTTAVGYAGGYTPNPTYEEVCSGLTGHTEAVLIAYDPDVVTFDELARTFWEAHDPTQGMRQGNDVGTQYRSALWWHDDTQRQIVERSLGLYQEQLEGAGFEAITTETGPAPTFYYAEPYHQQYLAANPNGYCGIAGTGLRCPTTVA